MSQRRRKSTEMTSAQETAAPARSALALLGEVHMLMIQVYMGYTDEAAESLSGDPGARVYILSHPTPHQNPHGIEVYEHLQHICRVIEARLAAEAAMNDQP